MKKAISLLLAAVLLAALLPVMTNAVSPVTADERIFTDPHRAEYIGRQNASAIIDNLNFTDLRGAGNPVHEPVVRLGALNIIKGYDNTYRPADFVTNVEMLGSVMRAIGREPEANRLAAQLSNRLPQDSDLRRELKIGYLGLANQLALITPVEYGQVYTDQNSLDADTQFLYDGPVTRQRAASWLYRGFILNNAQNFAGIDTSHIQSAFMYEDWSQVTAENLTAVETLVAAGALRGAQTANGMNLRPNDYLTRTELAQMYKALDSIIYNMMGLQKINGSVGGILNNHEVAPGSGVNELDVFVRAADGVVDIISNSYRVSASAPPVIREIPVFKNDAAGGLFSLEEGDQIEYLVRTQTNEVFYIEVQNNAPAEVVTVRGAFRSLDFGRGEITIQAGTNRYVTYTLGEGMNFTEDDGIEYLMIDGRRQRAADLSSGSVIVLSLRNDTVFFIEYIGDVQSDPLVNALRGVVINSNADLGFIVVYDIKDSVIRMIDYSDGFDGVMVERRDYYHTDDTVGFLDEVFPAPVITGPVIDPDFANPWFDPIDIDAANTIVSNPDFVPALNAGPGAILPGDIVYISLIRNTNTLRIFVSTDYINRFGRVLQMTEDSTGAFYHMQFEFEDGFNAWYPIPNNLFVTRGGRPVGTDSIEPGDYARVIINQAILQPGQMIEAVREISLEEIPPGDGGNITTILRGSLSGFNPTQKKLTVNDAYELTLDGWRNFRQVRGINISGRDIKYYHNNTQISENYATRFFMRSNMEVYIALERSFADEKVRMITFRDGRGELLPEDNIYRLPNGSISSNSTSISTDNGTIVRRYGRLVNTVNIDRFLNGNEFGVVELNNGSNAAVVDIRQTPGNSGIQLMRLRVTNADERRSFQAGNFSQLMHFSNYIPAVNQWVYPWAFGPAGATFAIDGRTTFVTAADGGTFLNYDRFMDYTNQAPLPAGIAEPVTAANQAYYVLADGARASWIIEAPWSERIVTGTVYAVDAAERKIYLQDVSYRDGSIGPMRTPLNGLVPFESPSYVIDAPLNSYIFRNNRVVGIRDIEIGQRLTVLTPDTDVLDAMGADDNEPWNTSGSALQGAVIFADR